MRYEFSHTRSGWTASAGGRAPRTPLILVASLCLLASSCGIFGGVESAIDRAVQVIDRGIQTIDSESAAWRVALGQVADDLPDDISAAIRNESQSLASRSIAQAGTQMECGIEALARRARDALGTLKAKLLGGEPSPLPPLFCFIVPDAVDLSADPNTWSKLTIHGYDMDELDSNGAALAISLEPSAGGSIPVAESRIGRTTHYQVTVNLADLGPTLHGQRIVKISATWNGASIGQGQAVVLPWSPERGAEPGGGGSTVFTPGHAGGDKDFDTGDDEPTTFQVRGEISVVDNDTRIVGRVFMGAREDDPDHTRVEGWSGWEDLYVAPAGWRIVELRPSTNAVQDGRITQHGVIDFQQSPGEVVKLFKVRLDRDGDEAGSYTRVEAVWADFEVTIEETTPNWLR